jgi:antitoxin component of MazEF toxin-antitoxin module
MAKSGKLNKSASALYLKEPEVSYTSRIRAIGNSKGVILNNQLMESAKLNPDVKIIVQAKEGIITIEQAREKVINTDLSTWDKQFKSAIKRGAKPESNLLEGLENDFDSKEW